MSFWRIDDWTWQTFCYMPITDSISQLIDGVSIVFGDFGRLCLCHSVIALVGQFTWNWSNVAVNRVLLNATRAVWSPVFLTHHRPHHVSGVRGPENGSLFFRWIAYVISATAIKSIAFKPNDFVDISMLTSDSDGHVAPGGVMWASFKRRGRSPKQLDVRCEWVRRESTIDLGFKAKQNCEQKH